MRYAYYPGCSLQSGAKEYDLSMRAVFARLGIELVEIEDWSCCGAVHAEGQAKINLPARNLALAEVQGMTTIVAPCSGCYLNLRRAAKQAASGKKVRQQINMELPGELKITADIEVLHPLYLLIEEYGLEKIRAQVTHPLTGLRVASYYGCMLTRPKDRFDSPEKPQGLDELMRVLGAEVVPFPYQSKCCGGALAISHSDVTVKLSGQVLGSAKERGAEVVTLGCPMCHTALDLYQHKAERALNQTFELPILYFTQLMGLALGIDREQLGLERHIVSTAAVVEQVVKRESEQAKKRTREQASEVV
ncbi:MAG: CoB--CoM heterodisulfide reductase iron-sulfur subunit B family protein [Chloroflexota bacterium]|nr:CoB--CoM heterodisulfide reductase iron-sulfur subunit B family protein [Chloroflexota bacterium]